GSVSGGTQTTNGSGLATGGSSTLRRAWGTDVCTADLSGLMGSPVTFTAEGTAGAAGRVAFTTAPSSAGQSGVALAQQPVLQLEGSEERRVGKEGGGGTATVQPAGAA